MGDIALEGNMLLDAMKKIDYTPPNHFHTYPAPGPMTKSPDGKNAISLTIFEEHMPFLQNKEAAAFVKIFNERAAKAGLPDTSVEVQAAASYSAWQILEAGVKGANSLEDRKIGLWLKKNKVQTIHGLLRFNELGNYGDDLMRIKQVQNGKWVVVWPKAWAAPGAKLIVQ
jgi:branched-chain amino acid transport system substrate-binding protein